MVIHMKKSEKKGLKYVISYPTKGISEDEIQKNRIILEHMLQQNGIEVINSIHKMYAKEKIKNNDILDLTRIINDLKEADAVVFMDGWAEYTNCHMVHEICLVYNIKVYYANPFGQIFETQEIK